MSTTRAKFVCNSITEQMGSKPGPDGKWEPCVMKSVSLSPVYGNGDPKHENTKFWQATPSGRLELGVINLEAAAMFVPGKEYYLDISEAESS
ncbi:hypothetical protein ABH973_006681 [Bradyrhizobium ottawaense]|uniref:hypothetical protein n=1 Tax=Bradyrhizobium ottawaense TaxID=931866 RepID=UPI00351594A9